MPRPVGVLSILVLEARNLLKTERFGNIDPYVLFSQGIKEKKTTVAKGQVKILAASLTSLVF